jgi:hypothetical protein
MDVTIREALDTADLFRKSVADGADMPTFAVAP